MDLIIKNSVANFYEWESTIAKLNIHVTIGMESSKIAELITDNDEEICERLAIFRDLIEIPELVELFKKLKETIDTIFEIDEKSKVYSSGLDRTLCDFHMVEMYVDMVDKIRVLYENIKEKIKSERTKSLFLSFVEFCDSERYADLKVLINDIIRGQGTVKSFSLAINLNQKLEPYEIGLIGMNDHYFTEKNIYTSFFKSNKSGFEYAVPLARYYGGNTVLEKGLYLAANEQLTKLIKKTQRALIVEMRESLKSILSQKDDIAFILKAKRYVDSYVDFVCYPEMHNETSIVHAYDPTLNAKMNIRDIVKNDINFNKNGQIYIVTGANSGGKSVYVKTTGIMQIFFQLGLPIPAKSARIKPVRNIFTHFATSIDNSDSRFVLECKAMKDILDRIDDNSLLLMDESFSSTSAFEGEAVARQVLERLQTVGCKCVFSTHLHELTSMEEANEEGFAKIENLHVEMRDGFPTYRIIKGAADGKSYAYDIAKKYGLEHLKSKK